MLDVTQIAYGLRRILGTQWTTDRKAAIECNGQIIYRLPAPLSDKPSCLMFTQPKSGSKMVRGILRKLARRSGLQPTGPDGAFFAAGTRRGEVPTEIFKPRGYFYHFSNVPKEYSIPLEAPTLVHVRDVRDVLVSKYYSLRESHPEPGDAVKPDRKDFFTTRRKLLRDLSIDEGVLKLANQGLKNAIEGLKNAADRSGAMLTRYEDMVYRKEEWAQEVCQHFAWHRSKAEISRAVAPFDVFPNGEHPGRHLRQVHPGNYRQKLRPETIEDLNTMFKNELEFFGYHVS